MDKWALFDSVMEQLMNQVFFFINATLFNHLIEHPDLCTPSTGFQLKLSLSLLEDWIVGSSHIPKNKAFLHSIRSQLEPIKQVANLLVMNDNKVFKDEESFSCAFSRLNILQIQHFVHSFQPDNASRTVASDETMDLILSKFANKDAQMFLQVDPNALI